MMTKEEVAGIVAYCEEKKISYVATPKRNEADGTQRMLNAIESFADTQCSEG